MTGKEFVQDGYDQPCLLVTSTVARLDPRRLESFRAAGFRIRERYDLNDSTDERALSEALVGAWGAVAGTERYSREVLTSAPDLRVIARCGVGLDAIDERAASDLGVAVLTTPGTNSDAVADFTIMLMLASLRQLAAADRAVRDGSWRHPTIGRDLTGATVAVVGVGSIGQAVARRLAGFGCKILGVDPFADPWTCEHLGISLVGVETALSQADIVTIHAPLNAQTRGMIGSREMGLLPPGAVLINTARGGIVDEDALLDALGTGHLLAAGLDVFAKEPLRIDHPFTGIDQVLLTGHIATYSERSVHATLDRVLQGLMALWTSSRSRVNAKDASLQGLGDS